MDILFCWRGNALSVVEYKLSWCSLTVRRVRPVVQRYACLLELDTVNHLTARENQPSWDFGLGSSLRLRHVSALTLSSRLTQPSGRAEHH